MATLQMLFVLFFPQVFLNEGCIPGCHGANINGTAPGPFLKDNFRAQEDINKKDINFYFGSPAPFGSDTVVNVTLQCENQPDKQSLYTKNTINNAEITMKKPCVEYLPCSIRAFNEAGYGAAVNKTFAINAAPGPFSKNNFMAQKDITNKEIHFHFGSPVPFGCDIVSVILECENQPKIQKMYTEDTIKSAKITMNEPCVEYLPCSIRALNEAGFGTAVNKTFAINAKCDTGSTSLKIEVIVAIALGGSLVLSIVVGVVLFKRWSKIQLRKEKQWAQQVITANRNSVNTMQSFNQQNVYVDAVEVARAIVDALKKGNLLPGGDVAAGIYSTDMPKSHEYPREKLHLKKKIGEGNFGCVYKAVAENIRGSKGKSWVAVKLLKANAKGKDRNDFYDELDLMQQLPYHPNVVQFLGCCTGKGEPLIIVEFLPLGDLLGLLRSSTTQRGNPNSTFLKEENFISYAYNIAKGMSHLGSCDIVHRDLACRNILISEAGVCKVADLGLARIVSHNGTYKSDRPESLPIKWMSPEAVCERIFTKKSDVWSFGITLWEIITIGGSPYAGYNSTEVIQLLTASRKIYKNPRPYHCSDQLYYVMAECWQEKPKYRPTFEDIEITLLNMKQNASHYLRLDDFHDSDYVRTGTAEDDVAGKYDMSHSNNAYDHRQENHRYTESYQ